MKTLKGLHLSQIYKNTNIKKEEIKYKANLEIIKQRKRLKIVIKTL